jgi:hypothetical protein
MYLEARRDVCFLSSVLTSFAAGTQTATYNSGDPEHELRRAQEIGLIRDAGMIQRAEGI